MFRFIISILLLITLLFSCRKDKDIVEPTLVILEPTEVVLNPTGKAPLSAVATIQTNEDSRVRIQINGNQPLSHKFTKFQKNHEVHVLGLYPDQNNEVIFQITNEALYSIYDTVYIQTQAIPAFFPEVVINKASVAQMEPGWTLCDFSSGRNSHLATYPFIVDHEGTVRWYLDLSYTNGLVMPVSQLKNGNIIYAFGKRIWELDMTGRVQNDWTVTDYYQHHDVVEKANGNILVPVNKIAAATIEDHILELDRNSGSIVNVWDIREVLDMSRTVIDGNSVDWFHMNAIWPDESDGGIIISGKSQCVLKVSADNELQWILAPHKGWGKAGVDGDGHETSEYLLTAIDANGVPYPEEVQMGDANAPDFDWGWGQHAVMKLENGNIMFFDNGSERQYNNSPENYSRMVEYVVDQENMTVQQVWSFGQSYGEEMQSLIISDVDELPSTGNRLMTPGIVWNNADSYSRIMEVSYPSQEVVFDATINFTNLDNSNEFIWHRFDIIYRAERLSLYR